MAEIVNAIESLYRQIESFTENSAWINTEQ